MRGKLFLLAVRQDNRWYGLTAGPHLQNSTEFCSEAVDANDRWADHKHNSEQQMHHSKRRSRSLDSVNIWPFAAHDEESWPQQVALCCAGLLWGLCETNQLAVMRAFESPHKFSRVSD